VTYDGGATGSCAPAKRPIASPANKTAHDESWKRLKELLAKNLSVALERGQTCPQERNGDRAD